MVAQNNWDIRQSYIVPPRVWGKFPVCKWQNRTVGSSGYDIVTGRQIQFWKIQKNVDRPWKFGTERNGTKEKISENIRFLGFRNPNPKRNRNMCGGKNTVFYFLSFWFFFASHHNPLFVRSRTTAHHIIEHTHRPCTLHPYPRILQHQHRRKVPVIYPNTVSVSYLCTLLKGAWLLAILNLAKMYHMESLYIALITNEW